MHKLLLSGFLLLYPSLFADDSSVPPPGDPNVFLIFLDFHEHLLREATRLRISGDVRGADNLEAARRRRLQLSPAATDAISSAYRTLTASLAAQQSAAKAYANRAMTNRQPLDPSRLKNFEADRVSAIQRTEATLKATLSSSDREALFNFLDNEFRSSVHRAPLK